MPDYYDIGDERYPVKDMIYNNKVLVEKGLYEFLNSAVKQRAGKVIVSLIYRESKRETI